MAIDEKKMVEKSQINGTIIPLPMPTQLHYELTIRNKSTGDLWLIDPEDGVQITRAVDCVPSKMTKCLKTLTSILKKVTQLSSL